MEQFLADYGLIWVGADEIQDPENADFEKSDDEETDKINWELIIKNIEELNLLGGEGRTTIADKSGAKQLVPNIPNMKLSLYSNGIMLGQGPFRTLKQSEHFLNDVRDGYFPR
jgi:hypothetical protein